MAKYFKCTTNKSPISYKCDEKMVFTITARDTAIDTTCNHIKWQIRTDDGKQSEGFSSCEPGKPLILESSISRPGFVRVTCTAYNNEFAVDSSFDILEAIALKYLHIPYSISMYILNTVLVVLGAIFYDASAEYLVFENGFSEALGACIYVFLLGLVVDTITFGGYNKRAVFIRSSKSIRHSE